MSDITSFQRARRLGAVREKDFKAVEHNAGLSVSETISSELKDRNVPHSLAEAQGLARARREVEAEVKEVETFADPPAQLEYEESGRARRKEAGLPEDAPESVGDKLLRADRRAGSTASVVVEGGNVVGVRIEPEPLHKFSAEHYAPPTSVHPGTDGYVPEARELMKKNSAVDPDVPHETPAPEETTLGLRDDDEIGKRDAKLRAEQDKETKKLARERAKLAQEEQEEEDDSNASTAHQVAGTTRAGRAMNPRARARDVKQEDAPPAKHLPEGGSVAAEAAQRGLSDNARDAAPKAVTPPNVPAKESGSTPPKTSAGDK